VDREFASETETHLFVLVVVHRGGVARRLLEPLEGERPAPGHCDPAPAFVRFVRLGVVEGTGSMRVKCAVALFKVVVGVGTSSSADSAEHRARVVQVVSRDVLVQFDPQTRRFGDLDVPVPDERPSRTARSSHQSTSSA